MGKCAMTAPRLLYTDTSFRDIGVTRRYSLKLSFGCRGNNSFSLSTGADLELSKRSLAYLPGTELGGIIRGPGSSSDGRSSHRVYMGTTWAGILDEHFLCPDEGASHITVSGDLANIVEMLLCREGLDELFAPGDISGISVPAMQLDRFCSLYEGLRSIYRVLDCRPTFRRESAGKTLIGCASRQSVVSDGTNATSGFTIQRLYPVNHLVCLGKGEGVDRIVVHLFANAQGFVSRVQTLFGLDEVERKYDFSTAEEDDLIERGTEKLKELQKFVEVDVKAPDAGKYGIGDAFGVLDKVTGDGVSAHVEQIDVTVEKSGKPRYAFILGDAEFGVPTPKAYEAASVFFGGGAGVQQGRRIDD